MYRARKLPLLRTAQLLEALFICSFCCTRVKPLLLSRSSRGKMKPTQRPPAPIGTRNEREQRRNATRSHLPHPLKIPQTRRHARAPQKRSTDTLPACSRAELEIRAPEAPSDPPAPLSYPSPTSPAPLRPPARHSRAASSAVGRMTPRAAHIRPSFPPGADTF